MTPEGKVKAAIKRFLKTVPDCWHFMPIGGPFSVHGIPDIVGICRGQFFAIEVKAPGKAANVTENQKRAIASIRDAGGLAFVATSMLEVRSEFELVGWI